MRKRICMVVALFCLGALGSCGGGNSGGSVINIAGNWQFTANSTVFGFNIYRFRSDQSKWVGAVRHSRAFRHALRRIRKSYWKLERQQDHGHSR